MIRTRRQLMWGLAAAAAGLSLPALPALADDEGLENTFFSPCGRPFRAPLGAPYPVAAWFSKADKNGDGKLDHAEFLADAEDFFKILDRRSGGVLDNFDIEIYEYRIAPEVLGLHVTVDASGVFRRRAAGAALWLAQITGDGQGGSDDDSDSSGDDPNAPKEPHNLDESKTGASPYSFFQEPEPVMAADFDFTGQITKANFLKLADMHFTDLDVDGAGFLVLDKLPKTAVQKQLEQLPRGRS